jgi:hypothetical protein
MNPPPLSGWFGAGASTCFHSPPWQVNISVSKKLAQGEFLSVEDDPKKKRAKAREANQNEVLRVFGGEIREGAVGLPECFICRNSFSQHC